jgi:hypothetical protein
MRFARRLMVWAWLPAMGFAFSASGAGSVPAAPNAVAPVASNASYGLLPLSFEPNQGQTDSRVRFLAHGQGYSLFLTGDGAVLALKTGRMNDSGRKAGESTSSQTVLRLRLRGARATARVQGVDELPGKSNYFIGNDPGKWRTDIPNYARVEYREVYPGVDLVYYGHQGQLEYDFVLKPGADARELRLGIEGAKRARISEAGDLVLETGSGEVVLRRPVAYQGSGSRRRAVEVRYVRSGAEIGFEVANYRRNQVLTIDPVLVYSTFLGGAGGDIAYGIAVDSGGNAYVTGVTGSVNFPVKSAVQPALAGVTNAFVTKLNSAGSGLIYSTFVGGTGSDAAAAIAIDSGGNAYITGNTSSTDFPVTSGVFQSTYGGSTDAFVAKIAPSGSSLVYSSYLGGSAADFGQGIAVSSSGEAYLTGSTQSFDFPTVNPLQIGNDGCSTIDLVETCSADVFVVDVNATASAMVYSTYLGGSGNDSGQAIAVDSGGNAYISGTTSSSDFPNPNALQSRSGGGTDAFVAELNPSGAALVFSTYLGGNGNDQAYGLVLDTSGNIYVAGSTDSNNFPTTPNVFQTTFAGASDGFIAKFGAAGSVLVYSTFIGGSGADQANAVAVDSAGNAVIVGSTQSSDFPLVDPSQRVLGISGAANCGTASGSSGVCSDAFVTRLNPSGMPVYSTFLGGTQADLAQAVAVDSAGVPYVAGSTASSNFPAVVGAAQGTYAGIGNSGNAFISKMEPDDLPGVALSPQTLNFGNQTLNSASPAQTIVLTNPGSAPLSITSITGTSDYAVSSNCGSSLPAGSGSCTINVTFTPTTAGPSTDELTITDGAAGSPHHVAVTGTGVTGGAGTLSLIPKTLVFPVQALDTTSPPQVVQVVNTGTSAITISAISATGEFSETNTCGAQPSILNAGASCSLSVTFTPTKTGSVAGTVSITDNAAGSPQTVILSGAGGGAFTLAASKLSSNILIGTPSTTFTLSAAAASSFTSKITLACSSGATCSFNPASITSGQSTVLTVSGLSATTANPLNLTVTGTSAANTATISLKIFLQDFSITATPSLQSLDAGQSTTYKVTATPTNGFNQVVLLNCSSILPGDTTCSWSPSSGLVLNGLAPNSATLTVTTTSEQKSSGWRTRGPVGGPGGKPASRGLWMILAATLAACAGVAAKHRRARPMRSVVLVALALVLATAAVSCYNYGYNVIAPPNTIGTPTGTYNITISGTLGSNKSVVRSTTVSLTVGPG